MSDFAVYNLLAPGALSGYRMGANINWPGYPDVHVWTQRAACTPGKAYTLSIDTWRNGSKSGHCCFGFYGADGTFLSRPKGYVSFGAASPDFYVDTEVAPKGAAWVAASWSDGARRPMVVEGSTPAAWAPAEGETLAGGGGCSHER